MKCAECGGKVKEFKLEVEDSDLAGAEFECLKCGELFFNEKEGKTIVNDLKKKEFWLKSNEKQISGFV